jgi:3-oxoacyl-[acyl-carrier-protein] synthase II
MRRVAVTGIGILSALGIGSRAHFDALIAGKCGIRRIAAYDPGGFECQIGGETPAYKIGDFVPKSYRKATKVMARDIELAIIGADDALKDAGLQSPAFTDKPNFDGARFGCNIGAGLINAEINELTMAMVTAPTADDPGKLDLKRWGSDGMAQLTPLWLLKYLPNMLACHVTIIHQLKGPSNTITCADASSHLAIGEAYRTIQRGKADLAICGGAENKLSCMGLLRQELLERVNVTHNDSPAEAVRPFDAEAEGTVLADGCGLLILEEMERAKARGAKIYGELIGFGASQDAYRVREPDPSGRSYGNAIIHALKEAKVSPGEVGLMVPSGLGIVGHDRAELAGLAHAFGDGLARLPMALTKAQLGNAAAGTGVEVGTAVMALSGGIIPPAINTRKPLDGRKLNVSREAREAAIEVCVSSTYSLGGQNAALVFRKV